MAYEIKITSKKLVPTKGQTYEKVSDTGNMHGDGPTYGYVPYEGFVEREVEVLSQVVDDLDLSAVIKAINNL